jgi:hypothetical protein
MRRRAGKSSGSVPRRGSWRFQPQVLAQLYIENSHLEHVPPPRILDGDGASQQMRSRPPCSLRKNIPMLGQQRKAARRFRQVNQLARQRIDGHAIPGFDRQHRCERAIPETQVDMSRLGGKMVVS